MSAPGIFLLTRSSPTIVARTAIDTIERRDARLGRDRPERVGELLERGAAALADSEHAAELAHRDLDADAGQEADEDAPRQEVGDEPELEQARQR